VISSMRISSDELPASQILQTLNPGRALWSAGAAVLHTSNPSHIAVTASTTRSCTRTSSRSQDSVNLGLQRIVSLHFLTSHLQRRARLRAGGRARELPPHAVPRGDDAEDGGVPPLDGRLGARQPAGALPPKLLSHGYVYFTFCSHVASPSLS
jgi:hypothetical protein